MAILTVLADGRFHSGDALSRQLGITRAGLWKRIEVLRGLQIPIEAVAGRGYRLPYPVEPLDAAEIAGFLQEAGGVVPDVEVQLCLESTNTALAQEARYRREPKALLAECQSGGRGRWGRRWSSPYGGGVYLSLLWPFAQLREAPFALSLAVGVTLVELAAELGVPDVGVKWPNDLLSPRGKVGGILIELVGEPLGPCAVVAGVGMNLRLPSTVAQELEQPAVGLWDLAGASLLGRNALAAEVIRRLAATCSEFEKAGFAPFRERWQHHDVLAGLEIVVHAAEGPVEGIACGVDERGALRLQTGAGVISCFSGDTELKVRR